MQTQDSPTQRSKILKQIVTGVLVVMGTLALLFGILGGIWLYNEMLTIVWNELFQKHTLPGDMAGVTLFTLTGLGVLCFKLNQWVKKP